MERKGREEMDRWKARIPATHLISPTLSSTPVSSLFKQYRQEKEQILSTCERQAQSYVSLGNETVHMLRYLTGERAIIPPFMEPYIVDRLAAMLDYNLVALVGEKCMELKVASPEKYRFNPKKLLAELMGVYVNLSMRTEFVAAVAKDQRSYKKEVFVRAMDVLKKFRLMESVKKKKMG